MYSKYTASAAAAVAAAATKMVRLSLNLPVLLYLRLKCVDDIALQVAEEFFVRRVVYSRVKLCLH